MNCTSLVLQSGCKQFNPVSSFAEMELEIPELLCCEGSLKAGSDSLLESMAIMGWQAGCGVA